MANAKCIQATVTLQNQSKYVCLSAMCLIVNKPLQFCAFKFNWIFTL